MRYLILILVLLFWTSPSLAQLTKPGGGGTGSGTISSAADCEAETGGVLDDICIDSTSAGDGVWHCSATAATRDSSYGKSGCQCSDITTCY